MKKEWFLLAAILAYLAFVYWGRGRPSVTSKDARALVAEGALLLDVRSPSEFASGHIENAENIPLQELEARLAELPKKDRDIVVYCRSGRRSAQAKSLLEKSGYSRVHDLGGISNW